MPAIPSSLLPQSHNPGQLLSRVERAIRIIQGIDPPGRILGRTGEVFRLDYAHSKGEDILPAIPILVTLLNDENPHTRKDAEIVLKRIIRRESQEAAMASARLEEPELKVAWALIEALKNKNKS